MTVPSAGWRAVYAALDVDADGHEAPDDPDRTAPVGRGREGRRQP